MRTIWKYELGMTTTLTPPGNAKLLAVQVQDPQRQDVCAWFEVYDDQPPKTEFTIIVVGTGQPIPSRGGMRESPTYVDTFQLMGGRLVFHVYVATRPLV